MAEYEKPTITTSPETIVVVGQGQPSIIASAPTDEDSIKALAVMRHAESKRAFRPSPFRQTEGLSAVQRYVVDEMDLREASDVIAQLVTERDEALDRIEELERACDVVSAEFEKELWTALRPILQEQCGLDWGDYPDGLQPEDAGTLLEDEFGRLRAMIGLQGGDPT